MSLLDGKVVLVTGGGRGLGRSHSLALAGHGAAVVVADSGVDLAGAPLDGAAPAQAVVAEIEAAGGSAMAADTAAHDWDGVADLVARAVERFGRLDAVVNNAGLLVNGPLDETTERDFDAMLDAHMKGTFTVTRHVTAHWRARAAAGEAVSGRIVNTVSGAGLWGTPGNIAYSTAKSAIAGMTIAAALELDALGVTVNAISPIAATRMTMGTQYSDDLGTGPDAPWHPLDPANASPVVVWLCSDDSAWLTGAILRIDGNTVSRVQGYTVGETFRARSGEAVTVDELPLMMRKLHGTMPTGLFHLAKPDATIANPGGI